jgi:hypothetical protein
MARKKNNYTEKDLLDAIEEYKKTKKLRQSARKFNIPVMTLSDRINGRARSNKSFSKTLLSRQTEELLFHSIAKMCDWGFGVDYNDLIDIIRLFLEQ